MGEEVAGGGLVDDPNIQAMPRVGADITVADEKFGLPVEPCGDGGEYSMKMCRVDGLVKVVPVHGGSGNFIFDNVPVLGCPARKGACADYERTGIIQHCFLPPKAIQDEVFRR
jgi:hypothetical protein